MSHSQLDFTDLRPIVSLDSADVELVARLGGRKLNIACAVDGSASADRACAMSARLANSTTHKHHILHIDDPAYSANAPKHLQPRHLAHYYEGLSMSFRVPESHWICQEKETESESTCLALTSLAEKRNTDILVLGNYGAKHNRATSKSPSNLGTLGTVTSGAIRESHASICIVRATSPLVSPNQKIRWLFATDGSHASAIGFCLLVGHIARPCDIVNVITVTSGDGSREKQLVEQYKKYLEDHNMQGESTIKTINVRETSVPEGIIAATEESEADVLVLGIAHYGQAKLGSMSDYIVRHCPSTVLILKDAAEVAEGRSSRLMGAREEFLGSNTMAKSVSMQRRTTSDSLDPLLTPMSSSKRMSIDHPRLHHELPTIPSLTSLEIGN